MISHLGPQLGVADGIALANKLKKTEVTAVSEKEPPAKVISRSLICFGMGIASYVCDRE
jgi:hypothetical protein